jgi:hypothetical protein
MHSSKEEDKVAEMSRGSTTLGSNELPKGLFFPLQIR